MRISDWSSDVCSSDLAEAGEPADISGAKGHRRGAGQGQRRKADEVRQAGQADLRSGGVASAFSIAMASASGMMRWTSRSEEHTSELQSLMRISYAVFCLKKKKKKDTISKRNTT